MESMKDLFDDIIKDFEKTKLSYNQYLANWEYTLKRRKQSLQKIKDFKAPQTMIDMCEKSVKEAQDKIFRITLLGFLMTDISPKPKKDEHFLKTL